MQEIGSKNPTKRRIPEIRIVLTLGTPSAGFEIGNDQCTGDLQWHAGVDPHIGGRLVNLHRNEEVLSALRDACGAISFTLLLHRPMGIPREIKSTRCKKSYCIVCDSEKFSRTLHQVQARMGLKYGLQGNRLLPNGKFQMQRETAE